jgi:drug/metabolite transporter (DMT)-like permease
MCISVLSNAVFSGSFLVLISLTSPVLSSVAALLTIFLVAIVDWVLTGKPLSVAAVTGGIVICVAFFLLAWSTWREICEDAGAEKGRKKDDDVEDDGEEVEWSGAEEAREEEV